MKFSMLLLSTTIGAFAVCDLCPQPASTAALRTPDARRNVTSADTAPSIELRTVTLRIKGMTCGGCTIATRKVIERLSGVRKAEVSYETGKAVVTYDPAKVTVAEIIGAIAALTYAATPVPS